MQRRTEKKLAKKGKVENVEQAESDYKFNKRADEDGKLRNDKKRTDKDLGRRRKEKKEEVVELHNEATY